EVALPSVEGGATSHATGRREGAEDAPALAAFGACLLLLPGVALRRPVRRERQATREARPVPRRQSPAGDAPRGRGEGREAMTPTAQVGIIGGSGLYSVDSIEELTETTLETPFGSPSDAYVVGRMAGRRV